MVKYAKNILLDRIHASDVVNVSLNIATLSAFYAFFGAFISLIFYDLFDDFSDDWKNRSVLYQLFDVTVEISLLALVAFWTVYNINTSAPIFPVRRELAPLVDAYTSGMFFLYAIFLFMDDLGDKMKYLYEQHVSENVQRILPTHGSILDLSLRYDTQKTD